MQVLFTYFISIFYGTIATSERHEGVPMNTAKPLISSKIRKNRIIFRIDRFGQGYLSVAPCCRSVIRDRGIPMSVLPGSTPDDSPYEGSGALWN